MTNYAIIAPPDSTLTAERVQGVFSNNIDIVPESVWAVGTDLATCSDVRNALADSPSNPTVCVVLKITEYNGHARRDLWEKLSAWERS